MKVRMYQIDAFTSRVFSGNPAAVCPLSQWLPDEIMQSIAIENNLSETAFFIPQGDGFHLRWFTPATEVDLCGHATLASAYVLFNLLDYQGDKISFNTREGILCVERHADGELEMDFPAKMPVKCEAPPKLFESLGIEPVDVFSNEDYVVLLASESEIRKVRPDFKLMSEIDTRGVILTAPGDEVDFVSRFFAPRFGIDEDPVTGSAHCVLTPFWEDRLSKKTMSARQISKRGGDLKCSFKGARVAISGHAVKYMQAQIEIDLD